MLYIIGIVILAILFIYFRDYKQYIIYGIGVLFIGLLIIAFGMNEFLSIVKFILVAIFIWFVIKAFQDYMYNKNEKDLKEYLEINCSQLGYMTSEKWEKVLIQFKDKKMRKNYLEIAKDFAEECENKYFINNENFEWLNIYIDYIDKNERATITQLQELPNKYLNFTHLSPDVELIFNRIQVFNQIERFNGYQMIDFERILDSACKGIAEEHNLDYKTMAKCYKYYLVLTKEYVKNVRDQSIVSNIDSKEISYEDLL